MSPSEYRVTEGLSPNAVTNPNPDPRLAPGTAFEFGPSQSFGQPLALRIRYDVGQLPSGVSAAALRLHRLTAGAWVEVPGSSLDTAARTVTGQTSSFSTYALLARPLAPETVITFSHTDGATCAAGRGSQCGVSANSVWIVPEEVFTATFDLYGASGGGIGGAGTGRGRGGRTLATIAVYPGEPMQIRTGSAGNTLVAFIGGGRGGFGNIFPAPGGTQVQTNGSTGGGATDVRRGHDVPSVRARAHYRGVFAS